MASAEFSLEGFATALGEHLATNQIDLVDLSRGSATVRNEVAWHGRLIYEAKAGAFQHFQEEVALFWCDVGPVITRAQDELLRRLQSG